MRGVAISILLLAALSPFPTAFGKPFQINLDQAGPLKPRTLVGESRLKALFPGHKVELRYHLYQNKKLKVFEVSLKNQLICRVWPGDRLYGTFDYYIKTVTSPAKDAKTPFPFHVGDSFQKSVKYLQRDKCAVSLFYGRRTLLCPTLLADNIIFHFAGQDTGQQGAPLASQDLRQWRVVEIVWKPPAV